MTASLLISAIAVLVAGALAAERTGRRTAYLLCKSAASAGFVALCVLSLRSGDPYGAWVLMALLLCLAGDVLLVFPRAFAAGLVAFLLGHLAYVAAFHVLQPASAWPLSWSAPVVGVSAFVGRWLLPHTGRMRWPVAAYVAVITVMVWGALAVGLGPPFRRLAALGAVLFYFSDLAVARERFVARGFANRAWGLPAYYAGQVLLALSAAG